MRSRCRRVRVYVCRLLLNFNPTRYYPIPSDQQHTSGGWGTPVDVRAEPCYTCGHGKRQHIYNENACRPGFACTCGEYVPQSDFTTPATTEGTNR